MITLSNPKNAGFGKNHFKRGSDASNKASTN